MPFSTNRSAKTPIQVHMTFTWSKSKYQNLKPQYLYQTGRSGTIKSWNNSALTSLSFRAKMTETGDLDDWSGGLKVSEREGAEDHLEVPIKVGSMRKVNQSYCRLNAPMAMI